MSKFLSVEKQGTSITVVNQIIEMIVNGELQPEEKLPSERELQDLLKVGRPSVREALSALQIMNICETRVGSGTYITSLDPQKMTKPFEILMLLSKPSMMDLFNMREALEVGAIRLAAQNITTGEIDTLLECINNDKRLIEDPKEFAKSDTKLHSIIINASRNSLMKNVMLGLQRMTVVSREITSVFIEVRHQSISDHEKIVKALMNHDVVAAEMSIRNHLNNVRETSFKISGELITTNLVEKSIRT